MRTTAYAVGSDAGGAQGGPPAEPAQDRHDDAASAPPKMLIVDDQADVLTVAVDLLQSLGYDVLSAASGDEALAILERVGDIEVLLTDVLMPGMNGVELGREARKRVPGINVILISGFPSTAMEAHAGEPGEFKFLMKPYSLAEVAILLRRR